jgi:hypothetical protein
MSAWIRRRDGDLLMVVCFILCFLECFVGVILFCAACLTLTLSIRIENAYVFDGIHIRVLKKSRLPCLQVCRKKLRHRYNNRYQDLTKIVYTLALKR